MTNIGGLDIARNPCEEGNRQLGWTCKVQRKQPKGSTCSLRLFSPLSRATRSRVSSMRARGHGWGRALTWPSVGRACGSHRAACARLAARASVRATRSKCATSCPPHSTARRSGTAPGRFPETSLRATFRTTGRMVTVSRTWSGPMWSGLDRGGSSRLSDRNGSAPTRLVGALPLSPMSVSSCTHYLSVSAFRPSRIIYLPKIYTF